MSDANETVALANKVLELLEKSATQVGQTATTAFPYVVKYEWAQALTGVGVGVVFIFVALGSVWGFMKSLKKRRVLQASNRYAGDGEVLVVWGGLIVVTSLFALATIGCNLPTLIEPTGATIESILKLAAK